MPNAKLCQLTMLIFVAACSTQPNKVANAGPDLQCHSEETTGSLVTKSVCTTRAQRAVQQANLNDLKHAVQIGSAVTTPSVSTH
jgi:uncharacterized lipoprotein YajG